MAFYLLLCVLPFVNELNNFYGQFDITSCQNRSNTICTNILRNPMIHLSKEEVGTCVSLMKPHKEHRPDAC